MALDLNKPLRHKRTGQPCRLIGMLVRKTCPYLVAFTYTTGDKKGQEYPSSLDGEELENIPESRWLNVYANLGRGVNPIWYYTREFAELHSDKGTGRVAVIEDKQDGSPWILHQLEGSK